MEYPPSFMDFYTGVWYNLSSKFVLQDAVGKQRQLMRRLLQNRLQQRLNMMIH